MVVRADDPLPESTEDLADLARRGRLLVLETVSNSGAGHIGGPLSAMDLLVALYFRVLRIRPGQPDWPERDRFILSKGHSAIGLYVTMALRGYFPIGELATFDQGDSRLQGHPDMTRLPGLDASTGSLGQGLAVGVGIALGARMRGLGFQTYVMLGDGETQEGMVWESVMVAARYGLANLTAIVDCNGLQQYGWQVTPGGGDRGDRRDPLAGVHLRDALTAFGWRVLEVDGHDIEAIVTVCDDARAADPAGRPTAILATTVKGRGVSFLEDRFEWHARVATADEVAAAAMELGPADPADSADPADPADPDGLRECGVVTQAMRDAWAEALCAVAADNPDLVVLDGDLGTSTRADRFADAYPERFLQMGIAEQNMVGVAAGLATLGYVPWLSSFGVFLTHRAADPVRMLVAQTHANVKIGAAYTGLLTGRTGKTHQDVEDLAIMRAMPGMTVLAPGDATECIAMVRWASAMSGPVYLRLARDAGPDLVDNDYAFIPGRALLVREGTDVLVVSTGMQTARCIAAAVLLEADGISAGVLHVPSLKPVDAHAVAVAAGRVPLVVSAEEHSVFGGLGGLVAEILGDRSPRRIVRIGIEDTWGESASNAFLLDRHGLSPERVAERVAREVQRPGVPADAPMGAAS